MDENNIITSDDILGKDVVDTEGEVLGVIQKLHIDKQRKQIIGITVDLGFMKPDLFIGLEFIGNFGVDAVFLNTYPRDKIKGMEVISSSGKSIGHVSSIEFSAHNKLQSIKVRQKNLLKDPIEIPAEKIRHIGYNVILK